MLLGVAMGEVLVVDDEPRLRRAVGVLLSGEGFTVWQAATLAEAADTLSHRPIAAIVMEPLLSGGDDASVVAFLAEARRLHPHLVIVACHASLARAGQAGLEGAGVDAFLAKTEISRTLVPTLRSRLGRGTLPPHR